MPAQKRAYEADDVELLPLLHDSFIERSEDGESEESDRSPSSSQGDMDELIAVKLSDIRREVQCPICLGIIRKTRTVMECLHRFCRECIDKSMRLGNNECPACRTHCASRRSLRDDPNYDTLIAVLYPDIDKYEEEELAFQEEEKARNKQIQASIAQILQRQTEALGRKRPKPSRRLSSRGRKNFQNHIESLCFDENEDENDYDVSKNSSSADERMDARPKRSRRGCPVRFSLSSSATGADGADGGGNENDYEVNKETVGASTGLVGSSERLSWGKGGIRSHTRYGGMNGGTGKISRTNRHTKLSDYVRNTENISEELDVHLMLVSMDENRIPALQRPFLCCRPSVTIGHLSQYVALKTALSVDVVEMYMVKELQMKLNPSTSRTLMDPCKDSVQILHEQETLSTVKLKTHCLACGYLVCLELEPTAHKLLENNAPTTTISTCMYLFLQIFKLVAVIPAFGISDKGLEFY